MAVILALDQGTTSSRALVFDERARVLAAAQREFPQSYPQPGWVEHDAEQIWESQLATAREALEKAGIAARDLAAIGITNQRETAVVWDRATSMPVAPAIVWQDRRTAGDCDALARRGVGELVRERTGLVLDPYFSATKIAWLLDRDPALRERAVRGELAFGTVDTWLIWKLTGGKSHMTDVTNASRTMLFDIHRLCWDEELCALFGVPMQLLPRVSRSTAEFGTVTVDLFGAPVRICGVAGDQQAALAGQAAFDAGIVKNTYGTGCFAVLNTGATPVRSTNGLLTTIGIGLQDSVQYALEGSVFVAGAAVQWLRDGLGIIESSAEVETLAREVPDSGGVTFVPAFVGLGAPYWDARARGIIGGITRGTTRSHIARATLEAIALQNVEVLEAMQSDYGRPVTELRVDGGAAANDLLMQMQADLLGLPVARPANLETTALGAAYLAGLQAGVWSGLDALRGLRREERRFEPRSDSATREALLRRWKRAVERSREWDADGD
ncbi:MAG TPA: glycerol kinase GlpK [Candidatus Baltobacteraceae bacterium]|nr:glycerol kinase GlpK [Candidatus Baltobacteraceae bacterium]